MANLAAKERVLYEICYEGKQLKDIQSVAEEVKCLMTSFRYDEDDLDLMYSDQL